MKQNVVLSRIGDREDVNVKEVRLGAMISSISKIWTWNSYKY